MKNAITLIPARGGSKGIPDKNLKPILGVPLVARAVLAAKAVSTMEQVYVSTDSQAIAHCAENAGAAIVWRPVEISGDQASSESALIHGLECIQAKTGALAENLVFVQCTSPFVTQEDIEGTLLAMQRTQADCAFTATDFHYFLWKQNPTTQSYEGINHDWRFRPRRQDREPQLRETGGVYAMKTQGFMTHRHRFFGKIATYLVPEERSMEIDTPFDLELAETLAQRISL